VSALYEAVGALAIVLGLAGTWLAARHRAGWLVCIASSALWLPTLVVGSQRVAVCNVALSIVICVRNFSAQRACRHSQWSAEGLHGVAHATPAAATRSSAAGPRSAVADRPERPLGGQPRVDDGRQLLVPVGS
jgi:hypothetical protein